MKVLYALAAGGAVAQVAHVHVAGIGHQLEAHVLLLALFNHLAGLVENLGNGAAAHCTFSEDIFVAHRRVSLEAHNACTVLTAVVLLFHQQIQFVEAVAPGAMLLLVVFYGFQ